MTTLCMRLLCLYPDRRLPVLCLTLLVRLSGL